MQETGTRHIFKIDVGDYKSIFVDENSVQWCVLEVPEWLDCSLMVDDSLLTGVLRRIVNGSMELRFSLGEIQNGAENNQNQTVLPLKEVFLIVHIPYAGADGFPSNPKAYDFIWLNSMIHTNEWISADKIEPRIQPQNQEFNISTPDDLTWTGIVSGGKNAVWRNVTGGKSETAAFVAKKNLSLQNFVVKFKPNHFEKKGGLDSHLPPIAFEMRITKRSNNQLVCRWRKEISETKWDDDIGLSEELVGVPVDEYGKSSDDTIKVWRHSYDIESESSHSSDYSTNTEYYAKFDLSGSGIVETLESLAGENADSGQREFVVKFRYAVEKTRSNQIVWLGWMPKMSFSVNQPPKKPASIVLSEQ